MDCESIAVRLDRLEQFLLGTSPDEILLGENNADVKSQKLITELVSINNKLSEIIKQREKIRDNLQLIRGECNGDFENLLNPTYMDELTMPVGAQVKIIEASADQIRKRAGEMEQIQNLKDSLDSEHIRKAIDFKPKLAQLSLIQGSQIEEISKHNARVSVLVESYNQLVLIMSQKFSEWNDIITKYEIAHPPKVESS